MCNLHFNVLFCWLAGDKLQVQYTQILGLVLICKQAMLLRQKGKKKRRRLTTPRIN